MAEREEQIVNSKKWSLIIVSSRLCRVIDWGKPSADGHFSRLIVLLGPLQNTTFQNEGWKSLWGRARGTNNPASCEK